MPALVALLAALLVVPQAHAGRRTFGERPLQQGMRGSDVRVLQDFLTRVGLRTAVDGHYGPATKRRVRSYERRASLAVDGAVSIPDAVDLRGRVERGETIHRPAVATAPVAAPAATTPGATATIGADGKAIAPAAAPEAVKAIIAAGNEIAGMPYKYGGGHGRWQDSGYDCSGSISYALHGAGLLKQALDSTGFMSWGDAGPGQWVTIFAHGGHAYMIVAGIRFDTSGRAGRGTRWTTDMRSSSGYTVRHPRGL
jgi:hypothetical protein